MIMVTGGAGFIGSAIVWRLNNLGKRDILIVDTPDHPQKEKNLASLTYQRLVSIEDFPQQLRGGEYDSAGVEAIIHQGAISSTVEQDWARLEKNNIQYTQDIIRWCVEHGVRCVYASSAATYGDGSQGYSDDHALFSRLQPLNLYGKSKLAVDEWALAEGYLEQVVGLRYFNVFGPNEYHKEGMRSVVAKKFEELQGSGVIELFKSYNPQYADGEFKRDFVYVMDAIEATLFFLHHPQANGVFNVGTGEARSWNDVARAMFAALGKEPNIRYIDMPPELRNQYQYFTQADITKLKNAGYAQTFTPLEDAITDYVQQYLVSGKHLGA